MWREGTLSKSSHGILIIPNGRKGGEAHRQTLLTRVQSAGRSTGGGKYQGVETSSCLLNENGSTLFLFMIGNGRGYEAET